MPPASPTDLPQRDPPAAEADFSIKGQLIAMVRSDTAWSCFLGLVSIASLFFNVGRLAHTQILLFLPFIVLPVGGIIFGLHALDRGRTAGGAVGIALSIIGGILTMIGVVGAGLSVA